MKEIAEKEWGIFYSNIILTYEGKNITERQSASLFTNGSNLYLSIKNCLSGGGKECNICGETAQYSCDECKQEFCCDCAPT